MNTMDNFSKAVNKLGLKDFITIDSDHVVVRETDFNPNASAERVASLIEAEQKTLDKQISAISCLTKTEWNENKDDITECFSDLCEKAKIYSTECLELRKTIDKIVEERDAYLKAVAMLLGLVKDE